MRRQVKIRQFDKSDCGAASLASVAAFYGTSVPVSEIRLLSGCDSSGCTVKGIVDAATHLGFDAGGYKGDPSSLSKIPLPAILHLRKPDGWLHYVVLYGIKADKFEVMDPSEGKFVRVKKELLLQEWSGIIVLVAPGDNYKAHSLGEGIAKRLLKIALKDWPGYLKILTLSVIHISLSLTISLFIKFLLDKIIPSQDFTLLYKYASLLIVVLIITAIVTVLRGRAMIGVSLRADRELIGGYLEHLHKLPLAFFRSMKTGELVSRLNDTYRIRNFITETATGGVISAFTLLFATAVLFLTDSKLAWLCVAFIPVFLTLYLIHYKFSRPVAGEVMESASRFQSSVIESIRAFETIKNMGIERASLIENLGRLETMNNNSKALGRLSVFVSGAGEFSSGLLTVTVLILGGSAAISGRVTAGELISFFTITALFSSPLTHLASSISAFREGTVAAQRLFDIMECREECEAKETNECEISCITPLTKLTVKDISYGYPGRETLINGLSFELTGGEILGITGRSGCGKSTLTSILMRHLTAQRGVIRLNDVESDKFPRNLWREIVSIVPQNPGLYGNTLIECITGGGNDISEERYSSVEEALKLLELDKLAGSLSGGYISSPGEGGVSLSRGQQQRIAFARAVIKNPRLLIMDEATSSLDSVSEELICSYTKRLRDRGMAILLISHSERTLKLADRVITIC